MALKIERTNEVGITTTYHKITNATVDYSSEVITVHAVVSHYANEEYRKKNVRASADISTFSHDYPLGVFEGDIRKMVYDSMKETEEYKNAEDV